MKREPKPLKQLMQERGMTQQQLAVASDLHISSIGGILGGRQSPNLKTMRAIADALGVAYWEVIWPEKVKQSKTLAPVA